MDFAWVRLHAQICVIVYSRRMYKYLYAWFALCRNGSAFEWKAPTRCFRSQYEIPLISHDWPDALSHMMYWWFMHPDTWIYFFYYFYYFFYNYGERCENVIQYDTKAQIDDNDSVLSRISHVTKLRSFNRHQTWQPVRNTVYMFVCMRLHAEIYTRSQLTRQIYVAVKCIRDDLA